MPMHIINMQCDENQDLLRRFEKNESFNREMQLISRKFMEFEQQIYYSPIKHIHPSMIIHIDGASEFTGNCIRRREDMYIINGQYQPTGEQSFEKLVLQIVQSIPRPKSAFGFIYINTFAESNAYNDFKKILELLPVEYLFNLTKIYVIEASFLSKAFTFLSFGTVTNYIKNKTVNIETLPQLSQQAHIDLQLLSKALPKNVVASLSKVEPEQPKKLQSQRSQGIELNFINEPLTRVRSEDNESKSDSFVPIGWEQVKAAPVNTKKLITEYQVGPSGAPIILEMLTYFFSNSEQALMVEGLFRKSVSIDDQTEIIRELNNQNYNYLATVTNPHLIANAIKCFLARLREPLIPFKLFDAFMENDSDPHYVQFVVESIKQLPKINRMTLFFLIDFLKNRVLPFESYNKMSENNLCIVFGPCLMHAEVASIKELIYAKKVIIVTSIFFKQFQTIFGDKNEQAKLKRNSYKEYRIEENKNRENKSKDKGESSQEEPERQAPIEEKQDILLHRATQYIKEALENNSSNESDEEPSIQIKSIVPKQIDFSLQTSHKYEQYSLINKKKTDTTGIEKMQGDGEANFSQ